MRGLDVESAEHTYELLLDVKNRVQGAYLVGKGGIDVCHIDPREVFKAAFVSNSPGFILVHNHPSGVCEPSPEDIQLARRISAGSELLGLGFADFVIIGGDHYFSFHEAGLMPRRPEAP